MKKFLLLTALAGMLVQANAQDNPTITLTTEASLATESAVNDMRQGFGRNSTFYINDKAKKQVIAYNLDGTQKAVVAELDEAATGIGYDDAGNIIVSQITFPAPPTANSMIAVIPAAGGTPIKSVMPDGLVQGRIDFFGSFYGDFTKQGVMALAGADNKTGVPMMVFQNGAFTGGANTYRNVDIEGDAINATSSTVIMHYQLPNEEMPHFVYVSRSVNPIDFAVKPTGDGKNLLSGTAFTLPNKGAANGLCPFVMGGKVYYVYPALPNYQNAFAIAEANATEPIVEVPSTLNGNANGIQCNWLHAQVLNDNEATIYQYVPGDRIRTFSFKLTDKPTAVETVNAEKAVASVQYVNLAGQVSNEAFQGVNIVVTKYADGSQKTEKVIRR